MPGRGLNPGHSLLSLFNDISASLGKVFRKLLIPFLGIRLASSCNKFTIKRILEVKPRKKKFKYPPLETIDMLLNGIGVVGPKSLRDEVKPLVEEYIRGL